MSKAAHFQKPDNISIDPHRMGFEFNSDELPRDWLFNSPMLTTWIESLSILFPEGEQFFVDTVRYYRDQIDDPEIQKQISGFIGQEAMHSLEHKTFNSYMKEKNLPSDELDAFVGGLLGSVRKVLPKRMQLAGTCALEHITAMLANMLLEEENSEVRDNMHELMRPLWMWHAIEETEHKGVCYDLYQHVGGNYAERTFALILATSILATVLAYYHTRMQYRNGTLFKVKDVLWGLNMLYGRRGIVTKLIPEWLTYFRPGFHPWDNDNSNLVERWKDEILSHQAEKYKRAKKVSKLHAA